jgi:hypothetical protein
LTHSLAGQAYGYLTEAHFRPESHYNLLAILSAVLTALVRAPRRRDFEIKVAEL